PHPRVVVQISRLDQFPRPVVERRDAGGAGAQPPAAPVAFKLGTLISCPTSQPARALGTSSMR
ncbi:MAG: hypothetical protein ACLFU0_11945, partial [Alphaproteobacteria bacterium]